MRKQVSLLAEFLGAAKDLTNEYAELAEITEDEKDQIGHALMPRPARKATAQLMHAKGMTTAQIAAITGWKQRTIQRDLATNVVEETTNVAEDEPPDEAVTVDAEAVEAVEAGPEPFETYETIVLDPPWPMAKIERDVAPNQAIFDYPTMSEDELRGFSSTLTKMTAADCRPENGRKSSTSYRDVAPFGAAGEPEHGSKPPAHVSILAELQNFPAGRWHGQVHTKGRDGRGLGLPKGRASFMTRGSPAWPRSTSD